MGPSSHLRRSRCQRRPRRGPGDVDGGGGEKVTVTFAGGLENGAE